MALQQDGDASGVPLPIISPSTEQGRQLTILCLVLLVISWVVFLLRAWTRVVITRAHGWDDYSMFITLIFFTAFDILVCIARSMVSGRSVLYTGTIERTSNILLALEVFYVVTAGSLKIALGLFFLRIAIQPWQRLTIQAIMIVSSAFSIAYFFFGIFQCGVPGSGALSFWQRKFSHLCIPNATGLGMGYSYGAFGAFADLVFVAVPIYVVSTSMLSRREKITATFLLILAIGGCVASLARLEWVPALVSTDLDVFVDAFMLGNLSIAELGIGIIACSLATLRPLLRHLAEQFKKSPRRKSIVSSFSHLLHPSRQRMASPDTSRSSSRPLEIHDFQTNSKEVEFKDFRYGSKQTQFQDKPDLRLGASGRFEVC